MEIGSVETGTPPTRTEMNMVYGLLIGVAVVCAIGFISLVLQSFYNSQAAFLEMDKSITAQSSRLDRTETRLEEIESKLNKIQEHNDREERIRGY